MPLEPEEIQDHQFRAAFRGYDVEEVNHFLARVAGDFQLLLAASKQATALAKDDPVLSSAGNDVLASAKKCADSLLARVRRDAEKTKEEARAEASRIREQAALEAAATMEEAQESAAKLLDEAHALIAHAKWEIESLNASTREEVDQMRSDALLTSEAIVAAARDSAATLLEEAALGAHNIIMEAQHDYDERFQRIARQLGQMEVFQQSVAARVADFEELLKCARAMIHDIKNVESPTAGDALP